MNNLASKTCIPCETGTPHMSDENAQEMIQQIQGWTLLDQKIQRQFKFKDFKESLDFLNKVGKIAEKEGHHPDILIVWNKVTLTLFTHAAKGLTENDFIMAAKINQLNFF